MTSLLRRLLPRRRWVPFGVTAMLLVGAVTWFAWPGGESFRTSAAMVTVSSGPHRDEPVTLDTSLYVPDSATADHPAPAVLLAHGFGGSKDDVASTAKELAGQGYVVMTWSARGFGRSGGLIELDSPEYEVTDASRLLDRLAAMPQVRRDSAGDPRVGVVGGSYGGGLALLLAAADKRVDAVVPSITWNDLSRSFFPQSIDAPVDSGVFKRSWAGLFFGGSGGARPGSDAQCGRFAPDVCHVYLDIATTGRATPAAIALLRHRSPASVIGSITAPTLLVQGQADSLFPLSEADANARGIAAHGTPVRVAWFSGGHDGGAGSTGDSDRVKFLTLQWLDHYLRGKGAAPGDSFTFSNVGGLSVQSGRTTSTSFVTKHYPGLSGEDRAVVAVSGPDQTVAVPPNGTPAAVSSIPGLGGVTSLVGGVSLDVPGQSASFTSEPLASAVDVVGAPSVTLRVASPTGEAEVFVKLYDVGPGGKSTLPQGLVAPVRLRGLPRTLGAADPVTVTLPAIAYRIEAGHRIRVAVSTTDQAFAMPVSPGTYRVAVGPGVTLPRVAATPLAATGTLWVFVLLGLVALLAVSVAGGTVVARAVRRRRVSTVERSFADVPLAVEGLSMAYADGFVAVRDVSFTVGREQVVGLLGPNGAGKTTTLRMLMGLIRPTAGRMLVFGHEIRPGAPVLSRLGSFVEGTGFLPHLSGLDNLRLYWRATGRPEVDARIEEALAIAGLGDAIERKVRTYSQGMRQRLAIAQSMLGLPDLLVLDEPTNGLDPPQIAEMRQVLRRYATDGRTVLVSSHQLAEVEQTCSHVVVMHLGSLVAAGTVAEVTGESASVLLGVSDSTAAIRLLEGTPEVVTVHVESDGLVVDLAPSLNGTARHIVVRRLIEGGVEVDRVSPRRRLEDVFLVLVGGDKS